MLRPLANGNWNFKAAAHLLNRAGFGGAPAEIEKLAAMGHEAAVSHLVDYEKIPDPTPDPVWAKPDPDRAAKLMAARLMVEEERRKMQREEQQTQRQRLVELKGWWLRRMAGGPRPFQEKMTLFWHGHFATSMEKVRDAYLMWRQNDLFRRQATGNWNELLVNVAKDPAMLLWLDQAQSRKEHPNENFAREVMELFALGEGSYTEKDISEAARAFTGWSYDRRTQTFVDRPFIHDRGSKIFLGKCGNFDGDQVIDLIASQPQAARFITSKLWNFFAGQPPSEDLAAALTAEFRNAKNHFKPVMRAMLLSEEFYAPELVRNQVKSPVQWLVSSVRMLERELPAPLVCFGLTRNLGQDLFAPPNVKGWDGGLSWITTNTLLARYNEAATLVDGDPSPLMGMMPGRNPNAKLPLDRRQNGFRLRGVEVSKWLTDDLRSHKDLLVAALEQRLLQDKLKPKQEKVLRDYLDSKSDLSDATVRGAIRLIMSTPEFQLT